MATQPKLAYITFADYLISEEKSARKREYVDGEIYLMSGASRRHNQLTSNLHFLVSSAARNIPNCLVFGADMKLFVEARNSSYYPDLTVSCDPSDNQELYLTRPCLVFEVLSPSTASIDRREKRISYETLVSLREYVIVDQNRMRVDVYRRQVGVWLAQVFDRPEDVIEFGCLDLRMSVREIYAGVELPSLGVAEEGVEYGYTTDPVQMLEESLLR